MSSRGRGSLFNLTADAGSSSNESSTSRSGDTDQKDSGVGAESKSGTSSGNQKRTGRGKILEEMFSSRGGKGRANLFRNVEQDVSATDSCHSSAGRGSGSGAGGSGGGGGGRGNLFKEFSSSSSSSDEKSKPTIEQSKKPDASQEENEARLPKTDEKFFQPQKLQGNDGTSIKLACNYIQLDCDKNKGVFVYEVRFHPNIDSYDLRMKYLNEHRSTLGNTKTFDGVTLYLPILLKERLTTCVSKNVADNTDIEIRILYKRKEALKDCIHLYNVLFDKIMKQLKYVKFDRKQFDPTAPKLIPQAKLEVWPGYVTAVDEYEGGLMLCCDVSHRILCQRTVLETITEIYQADKNNFVDNTKRAILGSVVITRYNNRTYRIDDIFFDSSPKTTFKVRDKEVSYLDYYKTNHNIEIKDKNQPLLASRKVMRKSDKNKTEELMFCLIPELCHLTGLNDAMRSDFRLMREIATFTRVSPNQRLQALEKFYKNIMQSSEARQILENWGLSLKESCKYLTGRQLREEQIIFANKTFSAGSNADFSRYATQNEMLDVVNMRNWILFHVKNNAREAKSFCDNMERCTKALGMNNQPPTSVILDNDRVDTFVNALKKHIKKETQIVVVMCPTRRDDRYAAIKKLVCTEIPTPCQVIISKTLSNETKNRSICQKIALQMNCKLGGTLWKVKIPFKSVMICGIDSYHDASQKGNSVAAFVASLNSEYTRWYSKAVLQTKREEIVGGLCSAFIAALYAYQKQNKSLPENVIIYRDGVGDGQLPLCSNYEVPQFESAVKKAFANATVKITFIVVQKRINTRYFQMLNGEVSNPNPGTVLDHTVTRRNMYDFFLVSQCVKQGTVSPSHYIVLRDDANYDPDIIQRLSYKLCFLYYNWPGTIRIPACCQYAHKMAYLIGQSVRRTPAEELSSSLFYL